MRFHEVEDFFGDVQVAIESDRGPRLPVNSAIKVNGEVAYMSNKERINLIHALLGPSKDE